jgi:hypothetical protein
MHEPGTQWTFLTNHAHVLLCLAGSPGMRLRDVAMAVGVTERAVQRIVADLEAGGYLTKQRTGRRNEYQINSARPLRHPIESHRSIRTLIQIMSPSPFAVFAARAPGGGHSRQRGTSPAASVAAKTRAARKTVQPRR